MKSSVAFEIGEGMGESYFRVEKQAGHWWYIAPDGERFFSIGMNHIDSATLRYAESGNVWRDRLVGAVAHGEGEHDWAVMAKDQARASGLE